MKDVIFTLFVTLPMILPIVIWLIARDRMDFGRVEKYIKARGGKVLEKHRALFGKGWFGENSNRIYEVRYLDKDGNEHQASCKTRMWAGVYWTEDTIVKYARRSDVDASLEAENHRLREENERLRKGEA